MAGDPSFGEQAPFDEVADLYAAARPGYPAPLVEALLSRTGLGPGREALEIGPGTGQLTRDLARSGCRITAVERGPDLAGLTRERLAAFAGVRVHCARFEDWPLPARPFDAVVSATAFHWIDPAVRVRKAARALRPGGVLAVVTTEHAAGGSERFFEEAHSCYLRWDERTEPGPARRARQRDGSEGAEFDDREGFGPLTAESFPREITYTTREYVDLLRTYSGTRTLPEPARTRLLDCLAALVDAHGGTVTKRYRHDLLTARRVG